MNETYESFNIVEFLQYSDALVCSVAVWWENVFVANYQSYVVTVGFLQKVFCHQKVAKTIIWRKPIFL